MINTSFIASVKENRDFETEELRSYTLNDSMTVPIAKGNSHYDAIQQWIAEGNTPTPAYTEADRLAYFQNKLKQECKSEFNKRYDKSVITSTQLSVDIDAGQTSLTAVQGLIDILPDDTTTIDFRVADNSFVQVTRSDLLAVKNEILTAGQALYQTKWSIEAEIDTLLDSVTASNKYVDFDAGALVDKPVV